MQIQIVEPIDLSGGLTITTAPDQSRGNTPRTQLSVERRRYGVGEIITLAPTRMLNATVSAQWYVASGGSPAAVMNQGGGRATVTCPNVAPGQSSYSMRLELKKTSPSGLRLMAIVVFDVVPPSSAKQVHLGDQHWEDHSHPKPPGIAGPWNPEPNGGFEAAWYIGPADVYFGGIECRECGGPNQWMCSGICLNEPALMGHTHADGGPEGWFAQSVLSPWTADGTLMGYDKVYSRLPANADGHDFTHLTNNPAYSREIGAAWLSIPVHYRPKGSGDSIGRRFATMVHGFRVTGGGRFTVCKTPPDQPAMGVTRVFERTSPQTTRW